MGKGKKWQKILKLPIQEMHEIGAFCRSQLSWTEVRATGSNKIDKVAAIPLSRLQDFKRGEENNPDANCSFVRQKIVNYANPTKGHGLQTRMVYWCSYGHEDKRKAPPPPKTKRYFIQRRGCRCHFLVHVYECKPDVAFVTYNNFNHVDLDGIPCHGLNDPSREGRPKIAPRLSPQLISHIEGLLTVGVAVDKITNGQYLKEYFGDILTDRDHCLMRKDVINIQRRRQKMNIEKHDNDHISVNKWYNEERVNCFLYHEPSEKIEGFVLGIQTPWLLEKMVTLSHNSVIAMDATFSVTKYKLQLHTLLVFYEKECGLPVAWVFAQRNQIEDMQEWLQILHDRGKELRPDWKVNAFITDDAQAEIEAIRSWLKNIRTHVHSKDVRSRIFSKLGQIMHAIRKIDEVKTLIIEFFKEFQKEKKFLAYFHRHWVANDKFTMWTKSFRNFPHANQETNSAIESYHGFIKQRFFGEKTKRSGRRLDWSIHTLIYGVEPFYKHKDHLKSYDFWDRHMKAKRFETSLEKSYKIPNSHCCCHESIPNVYWVQSQSNILTKYQVTNCGEGFFTCDCPWALRDNICKHVLKITKLLEYGWPTIELPLESRFDLNELPPLDFESPPTDFVSPLPNFASPPVEDVFDEFMETNFRQLSPIEHLSPTVQVMESELEELSPIDSITPPWKHQLQDAIKHLVDNITPCKAQKVIAMVTNMGAQDHETSTCHQFPLDPDQTLTRKKSWISPTSKKKKRTSRASCSYNRRRHHVDDEEARQNCSRRISFGGETSNENPHPQHPFHIL